VADWEKRTIWRQSWLNIDMRNYTGKGGGVLNGSWRVTLIQVTFIALLMGGGRNVG
jgi:hypothetical protein